MTDGTWERIIDAIDATVGIENHGKSTKPIEDHPDLTLSVEFFEFERKGERYRIERESGPAIVDRKTHYSHRAGNSNRVEVIYDTHQTAHKVNLFQEKDGTWQAVELDKLGL